MNDQPESLEPGVAGRVAILTSELRALRTAAERLDLDAIALGDEVRRQGEKLDEITAIVSDIHVGLRAIFEILNAARQSSEPPAETKDQGPEIPGDDKPPRSRKKSDASLG
jgi:hypothetical protein